MTDKELKKEFEKYMKDSADYYDPREPFTDRKLLQLWLDCAESREKHIAELEKENAALKEKYEKGKELVERMKNVYLRVTDKSGYEGIKEE